MKRFLDMKDCIQVPAEAWTAEDWTDLYDAMTTAARKIAARHHKQLPAFVCRRCGERVFFKGKFSPHLFERFMDETRAKHFDCPLAVDGGSI